MAETIPGDRPEICFTAEQAKAAWDEWGFNCGPGALCAMLGLTPKEIRPHLLDFERKGYTNPTLMKTILDRLRVSWRQTYRGDSQRQALGRQWPKCGLVRIQWAGPWTKPGVPMRARYRHTHWVGSWRLRELTDVFDVNAVGWKWLVDVESRAVVASGV